MSSATSESAILLGNGGPFVAAYYYPGWHPCSERDAGYPRGWSEWDLLDAPVRFEGHVQPRIPEWGHEDESDPHVMQRKIRAAQEFGVDAFVFAFYWSRGYQVMNGALENGFLETSTPKEAFPFAVFWANRMPRRVMPVKKTEKTVIDPSRQVHTDPEDFLAFIQYLAKNYFSRTNYIRVLGGSYLSIFDTTFFLRQMGLEQAREAIRAARDWLHAEGYPPLHLAAIDPIPQFQTELKRIGFDSVTHYVFLPDWKGPKLQDFTEMAKQRTKQWESYPLSTGLPYFPSVSPGWDATPRAADYGKERPHRYPWSPVITGSSPERFGGFLGEALNFAGRNRDLPTLVFVSSWNEWTEGHYLEPDARHGYAWLEAVRKAKNGLALDLLQR